MPAKPSATPREADRLKLITLGAAALTVPGEQRPLLGPGKPLALLIYLSFSTARTATREHLTDLLWGDAEPDRARHALRQTLWQIRTLLGEDALSGRGEIVLSRAFASDREDFLGAVADDRLADAMAAFHGEFLPGFASPGGAGFEQWADLERGQLAATFIRVAETQARRLLGAGQPRAALAVARRLREHRAAEELGRRLAIESQIAASNMVSAAAEADGLERWAEMEHEPLDPATRDVIRRARHRAQDSAVDCPQASPWQLIGELVGREHEFAELLAAWTVARTGTHRRIHLLAPAGQGKSRLLRDLEARIVAMRGVACYVRANPGDRTLPAALLADVARALSALPGAKAVSPDSAATLVALEPSLSNRFAATPDPATGDDARRRRMMAVTELITAVASEAPIALLVDDLHWADSQSLDTLESIAGRLSGSRVLLVTASRPVADRHLRTVTHLTLQLGPLRCEDISAFLASIGRFECEQAAHALSAQMLMATGGLPLMVVELLHLALEREALTLQEAQWAIVDPSSLAVLLREGEGIRQRIARLDDVSQRLLRILGTAGTPLDLRVVADATGIDQESARTHLSVLEGNGFATQSSSGWQTAHDEIADQAMPQSVSERTEMDRSLGLALVMAAGNDRTTRVRAAQFLARCKDVAALATLVIEDLRQGDSRSRPRNAKSTIGEFVANDSRLGRAVYKALPLSVRLRHSAHAKKYIAVSMITTFVAVGLIGASSLQPADDQWLVLFRMADPVHKVAVRIPLRSHDWQTGVVLRDRPLGGRLARGLAGTAPVAGDVTIWANGDSAVYNHAFASSDPGGQDLVLLAGSDTIRLTSSRNDDTSPALSPDRRNVAFLTARWSPDTLQDNDIALLDLRTRHVRHLTSGRESDMRPAWSPDGTQIAFIRQGFQRSDSIQRLCTIEVDGTDLRCRILEAAEPLAMVGWLDWKSVLVIGQGTEHRILVKVIVSEERDSAIVVDHRAVASASLSPDRKWLACSCEFDPTAGAQLAVRPIDQPEGWRPIDAAKDWLPEQPSWMESHPDSSWLATIAIMPPGHVAAGSTHQLHYRALDVRKLPARFESRSIRWRSDDTLVASLDSLTGIVSARRTGTVWFRVSAGGWREDSLRVQVDPPSAVLQVQEDWRDLSRWWLLGQPAPTIVVTSPVGRALSNNGDGSYASGVWSRFGIPAKNGLALDVVLSTPINRINWQQLYLAIGATVDTVALAHAAGSDAIPEASAADHIRRCGVGYPNGEGAGSERRMIVDAGGRSVVVHRPSELSNGASWRLRVQIFDDGTCGLAINGQAIFRSTNALPLDQPMRIVIEGNSVGTRMLTGPLTVWAGDPGGVNWDALTRTFANTSRLRVH